MTDTELNQEQRALLDALAKLPPIEPAGDIRARFRERAETERIVGRAPRRWITVALAAALALTLGSGWWLDRAREEREIEKLHAQIARLSATGRYEWVASASDSGAGNARVVSTLTIALLSDSSTNVRVAAALALGKIADAKSLVDALQRSARSESSPFVQVALLGAMRRLSASHRSALIRALLARPDLDPVVRAEAEEYSKS